MKALVKVNGVSIGMFYQMFAGETQAEMHKRILEIITYRYPGSYADIHWLNI